MKKRYIIILLLGLLIVIPVGALTIDDCDVLVSYKMYSSMDEENYICKGKAFGEKMDTIYYSGNSENKIVIDSLNAYYVASYTETVTLEIKNSNSISLLRLGDKVLKITGDGTLKFKENSFVKKVINGNSVYQFVYQGKTILKNSKIYEGTVDDFATNYENLKEENKLPATYDESNFEFVQALDYTKMDSVVVTESWLQKHIKTDLKMMVDNGYGVVTYLESSDTDNESTTGISKEKTSTKVNQLESEDVILISEKKVSSEYELAVSDLKEEDIGTKVSEELNDTELLKLYDVTVKNGNENVKMKSGNYTLKIKLDDNMKNYGDYQIIYVDDEGGIAEYLEGTVEGDYIVFTTTHLSQYGVVGTYQKSEVLGTSLEITAEDKKTINWGIVWKVSILLSFILLSMGIIMLLLIKSPFSLKINRKKKKV